MPLLLKIPGITGEGTIRDHVGWLALHSFDWGGSRVARATSVGSHRGPTRVWPPQLRSATVRRKADSQSALIWLAMVGMTEYPKFTLEWLRTGDAAVPICYFSVEFGGVRIGSVSEESTGEHPIEAISFLYRSVTLGVRDVGSSLTGAQDIATYSVPQHAPL